MTRTQCDNLTPVQFRAASATLPQSALAIQNRVRPAVALFFVLCAAAIFVGSVSGQVPQYDALDVDKWTDDNLKAVQREASTYATSRDLSGYPANKLAAVQKYFSEYVPAKITQPGTTHQINDVMGHAKLVLERALRSQTPGAANVMRWLYGGLKPVAIGNYQPAARINAIQFIARLSRPPADRSGAPRPYPFVLTDLKSIYDDAKTPDGVRAAALMGIANYVRFAPANDPTLQTAKADLTQSMTQLLESEAPVGRDALAHAFLQRYAVSILTNMSTDASLGKQLVSISTDESKPDLIAFHSAAALANLPGKMAEGDVETKQVLMNWSKRLLNAYQSELDRLNALDAPPKAKTQPAPPESFLKETKDPNEKIAAKPGMRANDMMSMDDAMYDDMGMDMMEDQMGSMMDMMGMGMGMGMGMATIEKPQPAEIVASRKKLNYAIQQVLMGVTGGGKVVDNVDALQPTAGLLAATPADAMDSAKTWLKGVADVTTQLNDKTLDTRRKYIKALEDQVAALTSLANGKAVAPRAINDAPTFGFGDPLDMNDDPTDETAPAAPPAADPGLDALIN